MRCSVTVFYNDTFPRCLGVIRLFSGSHLSTPHLVHDCVIRIALSPIAVYTEKQETAGALTEVLYLKVFKEDTCYYLN